VVFLVFLASHLFWTPLFLPSWKPRTLETCTPLIATLPSITSWLLIVGDSGSPCADRWCTDICSKEAKHTGTQNLTWFGKTAYIHGRVHIIRDI
jgi:hypothetical protein